MAAKNSTEQTDVTPKEAPVEEDGDYLAFGLGKLRSPMGYKCHHSSCGFEAESQGPCPIEEDHGQLSPVF